MRCYRPSSRDPRWKAETLSQRGALSSAGVQTLVRMACSSGTEGTRGCESSVLLKTHTNNEIKLRNWKSEIWLRQQILMYNSQIIIVIIIITKDISILTIQIQQYVIFPKRSVVWASEIIYKNKCTTVLETIALVRLPHYPNFDLPMKSFDEWTFNFYTIIIITKNF